MHRKPQKKNHRTYRKRDYEFYGSLSQIEEDIKGSMFVRVHNSYLVNLEKIK